MPLRTTQKSVKRITVRSFFKKAEKPLELSLVCGGEHMDNVLENESVNRPALTLTGYFKNFAAKRIQVLGAGEMAYLKDQTKAKQQDVLMRMFEKGIPCMVITRNLLPTPTLEKCSREAGIPLFRSRLKSRDFSRDVVLLLEDLFAPRIAEHGTLMDVKGVGTLIRGKSGVGKSECALALIERGHSLVADDLVYIRLWNRDELRGKSSDLNLGYMECRGIGIVNIADLFGIRSVRLEKTINLVVTFEEWKPGMDEERTGLEQDSYPILGVKVPHVILPVRPGRDLARLVEVASMVQALKFMGHDSAKEFNDRLIAFMAGQPE